VDRCLIPRPVKCWVSSIWCLSKAPKNPHWPTRPASAMPYHPNISCSCCSGVRWI